MSTVSLDEFLKPISAALGRDEAPREVRALDTSATPHGDDELCSAGPDALAERFEREARAVGVHVAWADEADAAKEAARMAASFGTKAVYADAPQADACGLAEALTAAGVDATRWDAADREGSIAAANAADSGITFASLGIADTGTVVQECDARSGRACCLLPKAHIAILRKSTIVAHMMQATDALKGLHDGALPSNVAFITGPSSTSDIELVRVVGVHGSVETGVIIVRD